MNTIRFTSKKAFIDALEARRPFWRERDEKAARDHKAKEQQWLKETKATLRDVAKLDYDALKQAIQYRGRLDGIDSAPSCPRLEEVRLNRVLKALALTNQQAFTVDNKGGSAWADAYDLLTADPDAATTVC